MNLVTGSAGHLGEALMRTFSRLGEPAVGMDVKPSPFTSVVGSIAGRTTVRRALRGVRYVIHTATLHKPHLATHSSDTFVETNVRGTLVLLEEAVAAGVEAFVFTSTTSAFGSALTPSSGAPAVWITEETTSVPKNVYGTTKLAAEALCEMVHRQAALPVIVLRTSRFFPEPDDDPVKRAEFEPANLQVLELLHRRVDLEDVVSAHLLALRHAPRLGFARYVISASTPFSPGDLTELRTRASDVIRRLFPDAEDVFARRGWKLANAIDRVYVNSRARSELGWAPAHDFRTALERLRRNEDHRSDIARAVGSKGYHVGEYQDRAYPVV